MSKQYPQQPYPPQQPGWTPPPPPKKTSVGKIIGLGCAGIIGLFVVIGILGAIASSGGDSSNDSNTATTTKTSAPAAEKTAKEDTAAEEEEPAEKAPIAVTAKKTAFKKSILADGSNYTSVLVTVTNNSDDPVDVNPLFITVTDTSGTKHTAELAAAEDQIDTVSLAPGENISGTITGKGKFTPAYVTFTDGFLGDSVRANVS